MNKTKYIRMFEFGRLPLSMIETFLIGYEDIQVYVMYDGKWTMSYMTEETAKKTGQDAIKIFSSREGFLKLKNDFVDYRNRIEKDVEDAVEQPIIDRKGYETFFNAWKEIYHYYRKTEFFYLDSVFGNPNISSDMKALGEEIGVFKFEARNTLSSFSFAGKKWGPRIFSKISKQTGISEEDLGFMVKEEIYSVLDKKQFNTEITGERKEAYFCSNENQKIKMLYGNKALEIIEGFKELSESRELKGIIANKGYAKGRARVIVFDIAKVSNTFDLINSVEKGDILVTETTSPEWMPACKKAIAIVTAQGGLLSHAAIVSRELGIPCIVGVSNALKVIKDGDIIEVLADSGIINII